MVLSFLNVVAGWIAHVANALGEYGYRRCADYYDSPERGREFLALAVSTALRHHVCRPLGRLRMYYEARERRAMFCAGELAQIRLRSSYTDDIPF